MEPDRPLQRSHLFTIRLWTEPLGEGQVDRRGRVQYVLSGERRSFRDWSTFVDYLEAKLAELDAEETLLTVSGQEQLCFESWTSANPYSNRSRGQ